MPPRSSRPIAPMAISTRYRAGSRKSAPGLLCPIARPRSPPSAGPIRWPGDGVAKLVGADDAVHPRLRIIADERLAGAPRESVERRLDLWLKTHIEKLLGPLFDLAKAGDVTGIARGIVFQLIEALGVLERSKIAAEMKDLDQPSRASLRKYGVRFGADHIYLPSLLKPAA